MYVIQKQNACLPAMLHPSPSLFWINDYQTSVLENSSSFFFSVSWEFTYGNEESCFA